MGFLDYFRSRSPQALTPLGIHLEEHSYDTESETGHPLHGYGYALRDEHDRAFSWHDEARRLWTAFFAGRIVAME